jgi:hypothetical protein
MHRDVLESREKKLGRGGEAMDALRGCAICDVV